MRRPHFLWAGLLAAIASCTFLAALLLAYNLQAPSARGLEAPALVATLLAYVLLLVGVKDKLPVGLSLSTVLFLGWAGEPVLQGLFPQQLSWDLAPFTFVAVPLLALESLHREAPSPTYFRRAQVVAALATLGVLLAGSFDAGMLGHYIRIVSLALAYSTLGYVVAGSFSLMGQAQSAESSEAEPNHSSSPDWKPVLLW